MRVSVLCFQSTATRRTATKDGAVVVCAIIWPVDSVVAEAGVLVVALIKARLLALEERAERAHPVGSVPAVATADGGQGEDAVVEAHADKLVGGVAGLVAVLARVVLRPGGVLRRRVAGAAAYHFRDQTRRKGRQVGEDEMSLGVWRIVGQTRRVAQIVQRGRGQDGNDDVVVRKVGVELLVEGERPRIVGDGAVDARVGRRDVLVLQPCQEFL